VLPRRVVEAARGAGTWRMSSGVVMGLSSVVL
jgi:hypothetical protein